MFGATCDHYLAALFIDKLYCIADKITPCAFAGAQQQSIFFTFLHFIYKQGPWILNYITTIIKIFVVKRNKFKKDVLISYKAHASCILPVLVCDKTFTGKIGFNISNRLT